MHLFMFLSELQIVSLTQETVVYICFLKKKDVAKIQKFLGLLCIQWSVCFVGGPAEKNTPILSRRIYLICRRKG